MGFLFQVKNSPLHLPECRQHERFQLEIGIFLIIKLILLLSLLLEALRTIALRVFLDGMVALPMFLKV
jgi:hypothetical protein